MTSTMPANPSDLCCAVMTPGVSGTPKGSDDLRGPLIVACLDRFGLLLPGVLACPSTTSSSRV